MMGELPTLTDADMEVLFEADRSGRALLATVDEAAIRAIGFAPPKRFHAAEFPGAMAPMDDPVVQAAARRLEAAGLATFSDVPDVSAVTPSGPLLVWLRCVLTARERMFDVSEWLEPAGSPSLERRVTLIGQVDQHQLALLSTTEVPPGAGADPLPIRLEALRVDELVKELVAAGFAPIGAGQTRTLGLHGAGAQLVFTGGSRARLVTSDHRWWRRPRKVDAAGFKQRLWEFLVVVAQTASSQANRA